MRILHSVGVTSERSARWLRDVLWKVWRGVVSTCSGCVYHLRDGDLLEEICWDGGCYMMDGCWGGSKGANVFDGGGRRRWNSACMFCCCESIISTLLDYIGLAFCSSLAARRHFLRIRDTHTLLNLLPAYLLTGKYRASLTSLSTLSLPTLYEQAMSSKLHHSQCNDLRVSRENTESGFTLGYYLGIHISL